MAGSKDDNNQKPETNFVDDLDSMLSVDDATNQSVGLIDDDDAIDRLLIDDAFESDISAEDDRVQPMDDMDQLIADEVEQDHALSAEFDEFGDDIDDLIADIQINPKQQKAVTPDLPAMENVTLDEVDQSALDVVAQSDEFSDDGEVEAFASPDIADTSADEILSDSDDLLESMAEIDEFSEEESSASEDSTDFLLADFDISADEESELDEFQAVSDDEKSSDSLSGAEIESPPIAADLPDEDDFQPADDLVSVERSDLSDTEDGDDDITVEADEPVAEPVETVPAESASVPENAQPSVDYSALIAGLSAQVTALKKQQTKLDRDIQGKSDKDELSSCLETIDALQSEQKKAKRTVDGLSKQKPVAAYVANGLAIFALIVGGGLGYQGYQAKNQAAQIVEYLGKMQTQMNSAPEADSAEKEMLRNQLDELARADSIASEQIAELTKAVQAGGSGKADGVQASPPAELMQMGAAIESLQVKVAALEKAKVSTPVAKPVQKKPPVIQENWVVNLVAFKQDWYARRKAEEFASKGIPAKVNKTESKGETWYRLSVDGFKSQYEAAAYAARVKKTLNLDSVWVNKIKN